MTDMLSFAGRLGSGRSVYARKVAEELNWLYASFPDYIIKQIRAEGLDDSVEVMQEVGKRLIKKRGWRRFCEAVLEDGGWSPGEPCVVDGIRHLEALETIRSLNEYSLVPLVYVDTSDSIRKARLLEDEVESEAELERIEADSTEKDVKVLLKQTADLVINGSNDPAAVIPDILELVQPTKISNSGDLMTQGEVHNLEWMRNSDLLIQARDRGVQKKREILNASGGSLGIAEISTQFDIEPKVIERWHHQGKLLGLRLPGDEVRYPVWQFTDNAVIPGLKDVLTDLSTYDEWTRANFMLTPNPLLDGFSPLDMLRRGNIKKVREVARLYGEQGGR